MSEATLDLSPFCIRARSFLNQGRVEDALGLYGDVLKVDPAYAMAYADRGTAYAMLKEFDLSLADLGRAIELGYKDASTYCTIATVYFEKKSFHRALEHFAISIKLNPDNPLAYYNRSSVYQQLGNTEEAINDLERCLKFSPDESFKKMIIQRCDLLKTQ